MFATRPDELVLPYANAIMIKLFHLPFTKTFACDSFQNGPEKNIEDFRTYTVGYSASHEFNAL
jgi:hypothetical protein